MSLATPSYILGALTAGGGVFPVDPIISALFSQADGDGTMGYVRTRSLPSIIAGWSVGLLYILGGYRQQNNEPYGIELSLLASIVLGGSSIPRAIRLRKTVPMVLSVLATFGMVLFGSTVYQRSL